MIRSLWTAATGMTAQQLNMDVISNNLANVNTAGFKKSRADFQDLLYQVSRAAGTESVNGDEVPTGIQVGLGTRSAAVQKIFTTGDLQQTGNDLDLAIEGNGFFRVLMPDGEEAYTRSGAFKKDGTGRMVTSDGYPLEPQIVIPENATRLSITEDGAVNVYLDGEAEPNQIGTIELTTFSNPAGLEAIGRNLLLETPASGAPVDGIPGQEGFGALAQGFLEGSNVNIMEEMVGMITTQRAYEINSKAIQTSDQMLQMVNNLI
ncbi:MAG: flagellar basal-body rod protein FlgG [Geoalkalibacter sp.]|uniref:flagellar basal-body rod protein FlgG n=1 Tax=Geoalkalibacter sp. TaxID=3041440 RepID=UPI002A95EA09|nr:flagellar basal-body rod protein FlgG [Thermodesulfobacteriota bacterium]